MLKKYVVPLAAATFILSACTMNAMTTDEINSVQADCSNVHQKIQMLEKEKQTNNKRIAAGVGSVFPVTALTRLVTGRYETGAQITTGEWAQRIDIKLGELRHLQMSCKSAGM